jgi:lysophospholipase L1-like esterase
VVLGSTAALLAVLAAELVARAILGAPEPAAFRFETAFPNLATEDLLVTHPRRFWQLRAGHRSDQPHLGRYALGSWPFRGRPPRPAPAGTVRVLVLGDSCVFGTGLDASQTLSHKTEQALDARGWPPDRVQVLNLGVPGYSTLQIADLMAQGIDELTPDAIVVYPAAWNDQAPAMGANDVELVAARDARPSEWLRSFALARTLLLARGSSDGQGNAAASQDARSRYESVMQAWEQGRAPYGPRVPAADLRTEIERMLERCSSAGAPVLIVAPAHPLDTAARHPRTRQDALAVLEVAQRRDASSIDAGAILRSSGEPDEKLFIDHVHLGPRACELLAEPIADWLAALLPARAPEGGALEIFDVVPARASLFGDIDVTVRLSRPIPVGPAGDVAPAVVIGGVPLLDVRTLDDRRWTGRLAELAPGAHEVLVQTQAGVALRRAGFRADLPSFKRSPGDGGWFLISRPGDRARVHFARAPLEEALWTRHGLVLLDEQALCAPPIDVTCDESGRARFEAPQAAFFAQALVLPRDVPVDLGFARWSELAAGEAR